MRDLPVDRALRERAEAVIPGGMYGHLDARLHGAAHPQFFASGEGCRLTDVDGNTYVDFMCAWGPNLLGYRHPEVEAAARAQADLGDTLNGPAPAFVELAEAFVRIVDHADWAMFDKNGTDATTACLMIARAHTRRDVVLVAEGAYHGADPWCTPRPHGTTAHDRADLRYFQYNDLESVRAAAASVDGEVAAIVVSPFRHDAFRDQELCDPDFAKGVRELCDDLDAALVLDDVRAGFRLALGGSWEPLGVPVDLSAWSKGIANGHALGAVLGAERYRTAASRIYVTGSFWMSAVPMAAGVATLRVLEHEDGVGRLQAAGQRLRDGLTAIADTHGWDLRQTGPACMPMVRFGDDDPDLTKGRAFCDAAVERGVYVHPWHNMFTSAAHTDADVDEALGRLSEAAASL